MHFGANVWILSDEKCETGSRTTGNPWIVRIFGHIEIVLFRKSYFLRTKEFPRFYWENGHICPTFYEKLYNMARKQVYFILFIHLTKSRRILPFEFVLIKESLWCPFENFCPCFNGVENRTRVIVITFFIQFEQFSSLSISPFLVWFLFAAKLYYLGTLRCGTNLVSKIMYLFKIRDVSSISYFPEIRGFCGTPAT